MNSEYSILRQDIALLGQKMETWSKENSDIHTTILDEQKRHKETLYGNGKKGLTTQMFSIVNEFKIHAIWDRWMFGFGITLLVFILGVLIKGHA